MIKSSPCCFSAIDGWKTRPLLKKLGKTNQIFLKLLIIRNDCQTVSSQDMVRFASYDHLVTSIDDPLIPVKIMIFEMVARKLKEFLTLFQTD